MEQSILQRRLSGVSGSLLAGVALFALAVAVLMPAFRGGFMWGDDQLLTANPQVHAADGWWTLWLAPRTADYFPLTSTTFWAEWQMWGFKPQAYHVTNVLLHGVVVVLTWRTLKQLELPGAWAAAAIFAVHPVCVESVAWISERTNLISEIFVLLAVMSFLRFADTGDIWGHAVALVCFMLALLAKTTVVMLPFILLLLAWWRSWKREWRWTVGQLLLWMAPFFAMALVMGVVAIYFQFWRVIGAEIISNGNLLERVISAEFAAGFYLYSALWPFNLIPVYPEWTRAFSTMEKFPAPHMSPPSPDAIPYWEQLIPGVLIVGLLIYCWMQRREVWARAMLAGLGCYFVAMLPVLGIITMSFMRVTLVADHFQYISMVAVIALVVAGGYERVYRPGWLVGAAAVFGVVACLNWGGTRAYRLQESVWVIGLIALVLVPAADDTGWRRVWSGFLGLVVLSFVPITWSMAGLYQNEGVYWTAVLAKNPNCWQGYNHRGAWRYMNRDFKGSFTDFKEAERLKPENPEVHNNVALAESYFGIKDEAGMKEEAIKEYQMAVAIKDDSAMDTNLANAYEETGRFPEAIAEYKHAIALSPTNASAWCNMGYALMRTGKIDDAISAFMKAVESDHEMPQGRTDLYKALQMRGIDPKGPPASGTFPFDLKKALELLKTYPPPPDAVQGK